MSIADDRSARTVRVRTREGEFEWALTTERDADGNWTVLLASADRTWTGNGPDCYAALRSLRVALDLEDIRIGLNGARVNALVSGLQADMGEGRVMYLGVLGQTGRPEQVRTLDPAPLDDAATVVAQEAFKDAWLRARPPG